MDHRQTAKTLTEICWNWQKLCEWTEDSSLKNDSLLLENWSAVIKKRLEAGKLLVHPDVSGS